MEQKFEFSGEIAVTLGLIPAVVYDFFMSFTIFLTVNDAQEQDLAEHSAFRTNGLLYRSISIENIQKEMPFLTIYQIRHALTKLEKCGAILVLKTGKITYKNGEDGFMSQFDNTKAYAVR